MRVALGTIEVDDETRKKIRKLAGGKGDATRSEVKEYLINALMEDVIPYVGEEAEEDAPVDEDEDEVREGQGLPEPSTSAGTVDTDGTTPTVGNLGSAGVPGGSV